MKQVVIPRIGRNVFPYVISMGSGGMRRSDLNAYKANMVPRPETDPDWPTIPANVPSDAVTREKLTSFFASRARTGGRPYCLVFAPSDCVHVLCDGTLVPGRRVPVADTVDPRDYDAVPYPLVDVWFVDLPEGSHATHLCVRTATSRLVEVSSGAPCHLGYLDEVDPDTGFDPAAPFLDAEGRLTPPIRFRGAEVTGVKDEWILLGPVQPDGDQREIVDALPTEVRAACERIAGRKLDESIHAALWNVLDPSDDMMWVGSLRAA